MSFTRLVIICTLSFLFAGCSEFYGSQPPAPIYGGQAKSQKPAASPQKKSKSHKTPSNEVVKIQPLKDISVIKPEAIPSSLPPAEQVPLGSIPPVEPTKPAGGSEMSESAAPADIAPVIEPKREQPLLLSAPPPPVSSPELTAFEPMEATASMTPAVGALVLAANQNSQRGDLELAAASLERAIRIEPRNANLYYKLALLRLKQEKPRLSEDLAKKSALLAASDNKLKKHCWLLIAHVREIQQNFTGAKEARAKAENF